MKKSNLLILASLLLLVPTVVSCNNKQVNPGIQQPTNPDEGENDNNPGDNNDNPDIDNNPGEDNTNPDEGNNNNPDMDNNPDGDNTNPDEGEGETLPEIKVVNLKEARTLCEEHLPLSYKEKTDENILVKVKGTVINDYAITGRDHFIILADNTGIFPITILANKTIINKYHIGETYEVTGNLSCLRNNYSIKAIKNPTSCEKIDVDLDSFSKESTIEGLYEDAYNIFADENDSGIKLELKKIKATYVSKINESLFAAFDGSKHIIIHGDNYVNNGLSSGDNYEFLVFPTTYKGKRGCEFISKKALNTKSTTYIDEMKSLAINKDITSISKIDRYNDKKELYPFIIKSNCYVNALVKDNTFHFAFVDNLNDSVYYQKGVNDRPKAMFAKNHVVKSYEGKFSDLTPYYEGEIKGEFYFIVTEYASEYHAFQGFVINELINKITIEN